MTVSAIQYTVQMKLSVHPAAVVLWWCLITTSLAKLDRVNDFGNSPTGVTAEHTTECSTKCMAAHTFAQGVLQQRWGGRQQPAGGEALPCQDGPGCHHCHPGTQEQQPSWLLDLWPQQRMAAPLPALSCQLELPDADHDVKLKVKYSGVICVERANTVQGNACELCWRHDHLRHRRHDEHGRMTP